MDTHTHPYALMYYKIDEEEELNPCPTKTVEHWLPHASFVFRVLHHIDLNWYDLHNTMENKHENLTSYTLCLIFFAMYVK